MIPIKTRHMILLFLGALAIAMAIFWYNYSALGYSLSDLTTFFLAKDSRVQERLVMQPGTSTGVSIVAGTQTDTWLSNPDDLTLPRIELDGATGEWKFKHRGTDTTSKSFSDLTRAEADALYIAQAEADALYIAQNGGNGTNTALSDATLSGTTSVASGGQFSTNGRTITDTELSYLDGLTDFLTTLFAGKQNDLAGNYVASISDDAGTTTGAVRFGVSGDLTLSYANGKWVFGEVGSVSAKADIKENNNQIVNNATFINLLTPFTAATNTSGVDVGMQIDLLELYGTTTTPSQQDYTQIYVNKETRNGEGTVLLLHCDNPGSTTVTDVSGRTKTVTLYNNAIGTTTAKYGSGSVYLDGTNDYLSIANSTDFDLGFNNEPFTIEFFADTSDINAVYYNRGGGVNVWNDTNGHQMLFEEAGGVTKFSYWTGTTSVSIDLGNMYAGAGFTHMAVCYDGTYTRGFMDGVQMGTGTLPYGKISQPTYTYLGRYIHTSGVSDWQAYVDEISITKGKAKYVSNFTPPASELTASFDKYIKNTMKILPANTNGEIICIESGTSTTQQNIAAFISPDSNNSKDIYVLIGTTTSSIKNLEVATGLTALADSWDTRCDTKLKEVISEDSTLSEQVYNKLKLTEIKKWKFKNSDSEFVGIMIDDPNIPEEIIWRKEGGEIGGFSGTGFINFLYTATKRLIERVEQQQVEIDALKVIVNSKSNTP